MGKDKAVGKARFRAVKAYHKETLEKAISKKLADERMVSLSKFVAGTKDFFTSSSCAGRIIIMQLPKGESKREASFHRRWHRPASFEEVKEALEEKTVGELWLKMEPFILHIGCETLENAKRILAVMKRAGVKRGGIIVAKEGKFLVEFQGTQGMSLPLKENGKILASDSYIKWAVEKANHKLGKNYEMLERLESEFRKALK
ncbi:MAG: hypothetical protein JW744_02310 [Candidatus Diapherotrites archaeon]|uniref:tRNA(Phe) 7-((3-amino-3-carboxypropyl)-4-demethylwyosine(37)-N(4))-methyltransferase n=1 Tax=Candidatus Iainarchaeum sp. TaxID=3101447 RepID=A0A939C4J6_9ARCH|nr:hypothetical protein [Candidatus Diapherotrites archaeon]